MALMRSLRSVLSGRDVTGCQPFSAPTKSGSATAIAYGMTRMPAAEALDEKSTFVSARTVSAILSVGFRRLRLLACANASKYCA